MNKYYFLLLVFLVFASSSLASENEPLEVNPASVVFFSAGMEAYQHEQNLNVLNNLEGKHFFLWHWLTGSKRKNSSVSPSLGVNRAPVAQANPRKSNSRNPGSFGRSASKRRSNSLNPENIGTAPSKRRSSGHDPATTASQRKTPRSSSQDPSQIGASKRSIASASNNPANVGRSSRVNVSGSSSPAPANTPRPALSLSKREEYYGKGQRELGLSFGTAHSINDFNATKQMAFGQMMQFQVNNPDLVLGGFVRFRLIDWFGIRAGLDYSSFSGFDMENRFGEYPQFQDDAVPYSFTNNVIEVGGKVEFFIPLSYGSPFDIYGFTGISVLYNNPRIFHIHGHELGLAQGINSFQTALPAGVGLNFRLAPRIKIGYEFGYRYLGSNFLDGVMISASGYDSYFYNQIKISYNLPPRAF
jgi:hypothetical protein